MGENLKEVIKKEQTRLEGLKKKKAELDEKIKKCEENIEKYTLMQNSEKYSSLTNALQKTGLAFEDILSAVKSGDLLSLQQKIEETSKENDKESNQA